MYILEMNKRYLICPILPKAKIEEYGGSVAANNFCYNLIRECRLILSVVDT